MYTRSIYSSSDKNNDISKMEIFWTNANQLQVFKKLFEKKLKKCDKQIEN